MARQGYKQVSFEIPEGWEDKSVLVFAAPASPGKTAQPNVVVTREPLPAEQSLRTYADRELSMLGRGLRALELLESRELNIDGLLAIEHRFTWRGEAGSILQRLVMLEKNGTVFNVTASVARAGASEQEQTFEQILQSVTLGASAP